MSFNSDVPATNSAEPASPGFLVGGGEMGALIRAHDWSASSLGLPEFWPQSLRTVVRLMLNTGHPMYIWWGSDHACLYNDAYRESIGPERHPGSLGRPAHEVWEEIWPVIGPQIEQVMSGRGGTWKVNHLVPITRHGRREDVYWTYSYSPIDDEAAAGGIGGVLVVCNETTQQVIASRQLTAERDQLAQLFEQGPTFMALLRGADHRIELANPAALKLIGHRPVLGRTVADALPEAAQQGYLALLDRVRQTGEPYAANGAEYAFQAAPGAAITTRVVDFVYQPINDAEGLVSGIFVVGTDVTERARADAALRESEARFRSALTAGRMGSWETDLQQMTRTWSDEGMALFGLSLPKGRGQVGGAGDEYVNAMHPEDRHLVQRFRALADQQDSFPAEYRIVKPDGTTLWLSGRGLVIERGADGRAKRLISIMADATERKQSEVALRLERERLSLALTAGQMGAFDLNIERQTLWWSAQTYALFGVAPDSFVPTRASVAALIHPDDREAFEQRRAEAIAQQRPYVLEFRVRTPAGRLVWLGYRGQAEYDARGRPIRNFGIVMDITERKRFESLLRDADQRKDEFIATLAHELRNPLAPIQNAANLLKQSGSSDPRVMWCVDVIDRQARQMAHLLDELLDVSRMSRHQLKLEIKPLQLSDVIRQAVETAQPIIDASQHTFTVNALDEVLMVHGDPIRLAQVISNVLINSAKSTPARGAISLTVDKQGDEAVVRVSDSGIGIAPKQLPRIFEALDQEGSALNRAQAGHGVGLFLAKGLVELHGGTISARSQGAGQGSEFEIRLSLASPGALRASLGPATAPAAPDEQKFRILIADDVRDIADSLALLLEDMGHEVHVAYDGEQALRLAQDLLPHVVLLDLGMPRLNGYDACRALRAAPWGVGMTVIAQTGWGQENDRRLTHEAGFDHHVTKPVQTDALVRLFRRLS
jgi:PAS domain S-box-containing protein